MSNKQLSAGDTIESRCTKCRTIMNHTIVAMVNDQPGRVECNTCKGIHNYRAPVVKKTSSSTKKSTTPRAGSSRKVSSDLANWVGLALDQKAGSATPYLLDGVFELDQIVSHPSFGLGKVVHLLPPNKMEVLFQDGRKLLRCG